MRSVLRKLLFAAAGVMLALAVAPAAVLGTAAAAPAGTPQQTCVSGTPLGTGTYAGLDVTGFCVVTANADITVNGSVTIESGATLLALSPQTMMINGDVTVASAGILALGEPGRSATPSHDTVTGDITATDAKAMYLNNDTINGSVSFTGGGWGRACTDPNADAQNDPIGHDLVVKDNHITGSVTLDGWAGCWMGLIRNTIGGNAQVTDNYANPANINNPDSANPVKQGLDSTEVTANTIAGNLVCTGNTPVAQFGDSIFEPGLPPGYGQNKVTGAVSGECTRLALVPNVGFVIAGYKLLLRRAPDAGGLAYWVGLLDPGPDSPVPALSPLGFTDVLANSSAGSEAFVNDAYQALLGRPADPAGLTYWTGVLATHSRNASTLVAGLLSSGEFSSRAQSLYPSTSSAASFVDAAYHLLLGRAANGAGAEGWIELLDGGTPAAVVASAIFQSPESLAAHVAQLGRVLYGAAPFAGFVSIGVAWLQASHDDLLGLLAQLMALPGFVSGTNGGQLAPTAPPGALLFSLTTT